MYTSWYKNRCESQEGWNGGDLGKDGVEALGKEAGWYACGSGVRLFLQMGLISFGFVALILYWPSVGVPAAFCGFPLVVLWLGFRILRAFF